VSGIGDESICGSDAGLRDSWIFLLNAGHDSTLRLNSSLIRITLTNINRIEELVRSTDGHQLGVTRRQLTYVVTVDSPRSQSRREICD